MISWLFFIFILVLGIIFIAISLILRFFGSIFRPKQKKETHLHKQQPKKEKIFDKNEGEYVDYEEIK